jgi:ubiquinone biosynthesis protein
MELTSLFRYQRNAGRLAEIVKILGRYGLADWLRGVKVASVQNFLTSLDGQPITGLATEVRIRLALTELGTTFIKLGQVLSTRADLVGPTLADELAGLQDNAPAEPPETVRKTIHAELGRPVEELFAQFEGQALASASVGQVHRARLPGGQQVVVKVQHRDIEETVAGDLDIMLTLAELGEHYSTEVRQYQPRAVLGEFRRTLLRELDFRRELRNLQEFIRNFRADPTVRFPTPYPDLSSRRVLTMEFLDGVPIGKTGRLKAECHDLNAIARHGADVVLAMIFRHGFYHADPHPGNLLVLPGDVIGLLDCGMVGRLEEHTRDAFANALLAALNQDIDRLTDTVIRLASVPPDLDRDAFRAEVHEFLADYGTQSLNQFDLSGALDGLADIIRRYHIVLPPALSMLLRVLVVLEGTSRQLDRSFSLVEMIRPYYAQLVQEKLSPRRLLRRLQRAVVEWDHLLTMLPGDLADILDRVRRGRLEVRLEHRRLQSAVRQLVDGILTAALFLGSTQLLSSRVPPTLLDLSVPGALGCALSLFLGWRLFRATKWGRDEP